MRTQRTLNALRHLPTEARVQAAKRKHRKLEPCCCACGYKRLLGRGNDVHHITPVHVSPERATQAANLMTLCRFHHFVVGHLGNWRDYNRRPNAWAHECKTGYDTMKLVAGEQLEK